MLLRNVLLGTPAHDGRVDVYFMQSMLGTVARAGKHEVYIHPVQIIHDSLVQRARNDLVKMAIEHDVDDLIFIDGDQGWRPEWVFRLLDHHADVVGGAVIKKSDEPQFNVKALPSGLTQIFSGLIEVAAIGTGFLRISKTALRAVWDFSPEYKSGDSTCRMVFDVQLVDGELVSEDNVFCKKWRDLGGKVWLDPSMTCDHIGAKKYTGSFADYFKEVIL